MSTQETAESLTDTLSEEICKSLGNEVPPLFDRGHWKGRLTQGVVQDLSFKTQFLRFIDVVPDVPDDGLLIRLFREYFEDLENVPELISAGLNRLSRRASSPTLAARIIRSAVESLARQFIACRDLKRAQEGLRTLMTEGVSLSVDLLGEEVLSDSEARMFTQRYVDLLDMLGGMHKEQERSGPPVGAHAPLPLCDISLKASSFFPQMDPVNWEGTIQRTKESLLPLFKRAHTLGVSVTLDMERYYHKDLTIAILKSILDEFSEFTFGGIALQAYLRETRDDILGLIEWAERRQRKVIVRLVKGAYWEFEKAVNAQRGWPAPVFPDKAETDRNFELLTMLLFENTRSIRPAIATHNVRSISYAMALAKSMGIPHDAYEFQMLYGMADPLRRAVVGMGGPVRVYGPVGELVPGMGYLIRRLLESTSEHSFLRKLFFEKRPCREMVRAPSPQSKGLPEKAAQNTFRNEPPTDFSKALNREAMRQALTAVRKGLGKKYPLLIGDRELYTNAYSLSVSPSMPSEVIGEVSAATEAEADEALQEARRVWQRWKMTAPSERAGYLFGAAREMRNERFHLMAIEVVEVGKTWSEADGDVAEAIDYLEYYGREMTRLGRRMVMGAYPGEHNEYMYEPRGVGAVISPWNFPLAIPAGMVSAAIVAGNCVVFKPSGLSPVLGWRLTEIFRRAGLPPGVLQFLPGQGETLGNFLVKHPAVDFIAFTGSREVGLRIMRLAADTVPGQTSVKKVIAEMGGKNAIIVDETADLDEAVRGVLESSFSYQGQKCSACSRVIIVGDRFERFCERLKEAIESITIGPPEKPENFMGPVIDGTALKKILGYVEVAKKEGRLILLREVDSVGHFIGPALFSDLDPGSPVSQEEIFGPVLIVFRAHHIDHAVALANNTTYALTGGLYSRNPSTIRKVARIFRVGNLYINRKITGALVGRQPFGGFGMSGLGSKAGGPDYLQQFMNPKSIGENTLRKGFAPPED